MQWNQFTRWLSCGLLLGQALAFAQAQSSEQQPASDLRLRFVSSLPGSHGTAPAVVWLTPLPGTQIPPFTPHESFTLVQKNRMFSPHLLVIPVGAAVRFPNDDPFYHNVFSLFEGKRFDLGLYEAGSSKSVTFSREGVSYIFCNIHPEMSAVVLAISTPLYAVADASDAFLLRGIPTGEYVMHVWIEGVPQPFLEGLAKTIRISGRDLDLGTLRAPIAKARDQSHMNKFGKPYNPGSPTDY